MKTNSTAKTNKSSKKVHFRLQSNKNASKKKKKL